MSRFSVVDESDGLDDDDDDYYEMTDYCANGACGCGGGSGSATRYG